MTGTVLKSTGSWYQVLRADGEILDCRIRGSFRLKGIKTTNPIAVGDIVTVEQDDKLQSHVITAIQERKNYIIRKSINLSKQTHILAANIDRAYLIATIAQPRTKLGFIDRFLVTAEAYHIPVTIVFNKKDIYSADDLEWMEIYSKLYTDIGYEVLCISSLSADDVRTLKNKLRDQVNLFSGHSGVGKSTLINAIEPSLQLKTAEVSTYNDKGIHTTTFAEMHRLSSGGFIIDTPGIKELGVVGIEKEEVSHYFIEMRALLPQCKFSNCLHINEPGCAVKKAVDEGKIAFTRYNSYLNIYNNREEEEDKLYS